MSNSLTVLYGKFRILHKGHETLVNKALEISKKNNESLPVLSMSRSGPSFFTKVFSADSIFSNKIYVDTKPRQNIIEFLKRWSDKDTDLTIVCGEDRESDYRRIVNLYNGKDFNYKSIEIKSIARDQDCISSTEMERFIREKNYEEFLNNLPDCASDEEKNEYLIKMKKKYGI